MRDISKAAFYISYYQAAKKLKNDAERLAFYDTLLGYIFEGVEGENLPFTVDLLFTTVKPFIDADMSRKNGGAPLGNNNAKKQPKNNLENNPKNNLETNNVNVNVNVNDNVNENDDVNGEAGIHTFLQKNNLLDFFNNYGYRFTPLALNKIINAGKKFDDPKAAFIDRINYIETKYGDKPISEKQGLFYSSLSWESIPTDEKKQKKTKKPNLDFYKTAPKTCNRCGSKIVKWAGVPKTVICENCKTYWEYNEGAANEWKCSRGD